MIGKPIPHPRQIIISELDCYKKQFFAAGNTIKKIPTGMSGRDPNIVAPSQYEILRAQRKKLAPELRKHADAGLSIRASARALGIKLARAELIAKENNINYRK